MKPATIRLILRITICFIRISKHKRQKLTILPNRKVKGHANLEKLSLHKHVFNVFDILSF